MHSLEAVTIAKNKARMSEVALGMSLVAGVFGLWPAWFLVPLYSFEAIKNEINILQLKNVTATQFGSKDSRSKRRLKRDENS